MSNSDILDVVDMLEKKHGFTREDAKLLIDFNQARLATKEDLRDFMREVELKYQKLDSKIDSVKQGLDSKIDSVKKDIEATEQRLDAKIDSVEQRLDAKIDSVEQRLTAKIENESTKNFKTSMVWIFGMFVTFFALNTGLTYFLFSSINK